MNATARLAIPLFLFLVSCRNPASPVWTQPLESRSYAQPVAHNGQIILISQAGEVISLGYETGKQNWKAQVKGQILAEPAVLGGRVFAATENGWVYALEEKSGKTVWSLQIQDDGFMAPLTANDDVLLAPSSQGTLYAFAPANGSLLWSLPGNRKYNSGAVIHDNRIYIGGWNKELLCLNLNGAVNWRFRTGQIIAESPVLHKNMVFFSAHDDFVYALDAISGRMPWRFAARQPTRPFLIHSELLFATDVEFFALQPENGILIRRFATGNKILRIFPEEHSVLFMAPAGKVFELDPARNQIQLLFQSRFPLFKLLRIQNMIVASDEKYGIHGFRIIPK